MRVAQIKNNDQDSQGGLINNQQSFSLETLEEKVEEVSVCDIRHFEVVPDYITPTDSKYPFIVKTPVSINCIDGWNLVERAIANGKSSVKCKTEYVSEHSDEELAIRKVALRVKPKGGIGSYAETVRNTHSLEKILLASDKDLKVFHHGGDRKGESFTNNRHDNVREVLSSRLGKSVSTINQFLNHANFLDDETLNILASQRVKKDFFEEAQKNKMVEIIRMKAEGKSLDEITAKISDDAREYFRTGKISPITTTQEDEAEAVDSHPEIQTPQEAVPRATNPKVFDPWYGNESEGEEDSLENIKHDVVASAERLLESVTLTDPDEFEECVKEEIRRLCFIPYRLSALKQREIRTDSYQERFCNEQIDFLLCGRERSNFTRC